MTEKIRSQIMAIRDSGAANMLDAGTVKKIASRLGFTELEGFIEEHRSEYASFIMFGIVKQ